MTVITELNYGGFQTRSVRSAVKLVSGGGQVFVYPRHYPVLLAVEAIILRQKSFCVQDVSLELKLGKRRGWVDAFILKTLLFIWGLGYLDFYQQITNEKHIANVFTANRYTSEFFKRFKNRMYGVKEKPIVEIKEDAEEEGLSSLL